MLQRTKPFIILIISLIYTINTVTITAYIFRGWEEDPTVTFLQTQNPNQLFTYLTISTLLATISYVGINLKTLNNQSRT